MNTFDFEIPFFSVYVKSNHGKVTMQPEKVVYVKYTEDIKIILKKENVDTFFGKLKTCE